MPVGVKMVSVVILWNPCVSDVMYRLQERFVCGRPIPAPTMGCGSQLTVKVHLLAP